MPGRFIGATGRHEDASILIVGGTEWRQWSVFDTRYAGHSSSTDAEDPHG